MREFKIKEEYKPIVKRIILADGFWYGSKRDRKKALRIELPDIKRKHIDFIVDLCVTYDKVHGDGWSEARNHTLNNNTKELLKQLGLSLTSIPPAPKEAGYLRRTDRMSICPICKKEVKDSTWVWGTSGKAFNDRAHMKCVLKEANMICTDEDCGMLSKSDDDTCAECGEKSRPLTKKDKQRLRKGDGNSSQP